MLELPGYKLEKEIGKGGMATVYLAVHEGLHRRVAIKVMAAHPNDEFNFSERFMREARIVANLSHQNIVTVYDVNIHNGHHYIAMEYLPGGMTLDQKIKNGLTSTQALEIIKQIAAALGYAHSKGIVHRDVKPENIMFREDGSAVLADFGIARSTDVASKMTSTGTIIGTPHYMSPEQGHGLEIGPRSDIYSLGTVFYETLTGKVPYTAESTIAVILKHVTEPVPTLESDLVVYQPVLNLMMAKNQDDRYQSCAEIIVDFNSLILTGMASQATLNNHATVIQHATPGKRTVPPVNTAHYKHKINKLLVSGLGVSTLLFVFIAGYFYYSQQQQALLAQQVEQERLQQEQLRAQAESIKQSEEKQVRDRALILEQEHTAATQSRLQTEIDRQQQLQDELKSAKDAAKGKELREKAQRINSLLASAENNLLDSQLKPAYENYKAVLQIDGSNRNASDGINRVAENYLSLAIESASNNDFDKANLYMKSAIAIAPSHSKLAAIQSKISGMKNLYPTQALSPQPLPEQQNSATPPPEPRKKFRPVGGF